MWVSTELAILKLTYTFQRGKTYIISWFSSHLFTSLIIEYFKYAFPMFIMLISMLSYSNGNKLKIIWLLQSLFLFEKKKKNLKSTSLHFFFPFFFWVNQRNMILASSVQSWLTSYNLAKYHQQCEYIAFLFFIIPYPR